MATLGKHAADLADARAEKSVYDGSWSEYSILSKQSDSYLQEG